MVEYRENPAGMAALRRSPMVIAELERRAELGRIEAERIAPVRTGAYAFGAENAPTARPGVHGGGFHVSSGVRGDGLAYARILNNVRSAPSKKYPTGYGYGWALEFGNSRIRKQRILGRAIDAIANKP